MSWYTNIIPDTIKKNVCAYLIQRYLGNFFEEKLTREQLDVDFYNGKGSIGKISLDVQALNELGEKQNWPLEFIDGYIDKLYIEIPWTTIFTESCYVQVDGLKLTFQPKQRNESAESVFESMWNSMTSSMHLAEECAKSDISTEGQSTNAQTFQGIEAFAQTIDTILSRIKVQFVNTTIQVEHVPQGSSNGVGIVIHVDLINYSDESGNDPPPTEATDLNQESKKAYLVNSFATKRFRMQGITMSTVEFSIKDRTFCHSFYESTAASFAQQANFKHAKSDTIDEVIDSVANKLSSSTFEESQYDSEEEAENDEENRDENEKRNLIKFAQFQSQHEIRVKLKQSENLTGPKVSIDITLGSLIFFLSPRQFHVLLELANGFCCPDNEDNSNIATKSKCVNKPMTVIDYERVHQELQQNLMPGRYRPSENLKGQQTWSSSVLDESDSDENFHPLKNTVGSMYDSTLSGASSSMESSVSSSVISAFTDQSQQQRNDRRSNLECDPTAEISHFNIRIASVAGILLHEDILIPSSTPDCVLAPAAVKQMQNTAEAVFEQCTDFSVNLCGGQNFENVQSLFDDVCKLNHLRLIAAPLQLEGDEKTTLSTFSISAKLIAVKLGFYECIYDAGVSKPIHTPLLTFIDDIESMENIDLFTATPSFTMHLKYVEKRRKHSKIGTSTDISLILNKCNTEVDISIVDRITALLHPPPICVIEKNRFAGQQPAPLNSASSTDSKISFKLTSPFLSAKIRFPIPDFRPNHDMNRVPWWKPNLRSDYLLLNLTDVIAETTLLSRQDHKFYSIDCKSLDIFYSESEKGIPIHLASVGSSEDDEYDLRENRFSIKITKDCKNDSWEEEDEEADINPLAHSVYGAFENQGNRYPGPFSAKRVVHESDTPHSKPHSNDAEELIFPGDKNEIDDFIKQTTDNSHIELNFKFSTVSLRLVSKHIYELIYNRINNDLLLWEPSAPRERNVDVIQTLTVCGSEKDQENFTMCKSAIQYDSSDSESSSEEEKIFYSTYDSNVKNKNSRVKEKKTTKLPSYISIQFSINEGIVVVHSPVRDATTNNVIPCQQSELQLHVKNANIFIVSGYRGDENLGFVCAQISDANLYHCDMMSTPNELQRLKKVNSPAERHLHPTIYKSEPGVASIVKNRGGTRELFSIAVRIQAQHETHHVKTIRVSMALNKATLRHRMCSEPNSWISQIMDFFNVQDYPIAGYRAKDVLTELHLHLWDCAIDYRPLNLPLRSALCLGTFSMSSHLSAQANTSTLRFIAEECNLFLSEKYVPTKGIASLAPVDIKRDYINVIDVGLFELSLKTNDKRNGLNPHIDLRASNNVINIHTCSDSGHALMQLLIYLANNGDLNQDEKHAESTFSSPRHQTGHGNEDETEELVNVEQQGISNLSSSQHQMINELLGEAMNDIDSTENTNFNMDRMHSNPGAKLFFFPDENQVPLAQEAVEKPLAQVTSELGDIAYLASNKSSDTDDDFCIIGNDAGLGVLSKNGEPAIAWLVNEPLRVAENHLNEPVSKVDVLQAPKHFPTPVMKYTLCEMSIIWHIYGGNDFKLSSEAKDRDEVKKRVNFENTVSFNKSSNQSDKVFFNYHHTGEDKKKNLSWVIKGGLNRDHSTKMEIQLNKIKFQHDVYPENTTQASRQVIIVNEVEIRDRLESNKIDKFLHQYISEARPKQSCAHMISIRALHSRLDPNLPTQECTLKISLLPIKLNIDQDALLFLMKFFSELSGPSDKNAELSFSSKHNTPTHQPPIMTVNEIKEEAHHMLDESLLILLDENKKEIKSDDQINQTTSQDSLPIYFRQVTFSPEMLIRLDYMGKHVDMTHGSIPGLLMGLAQLHSSEIRLKRISYRHGLLGVDKLVHYLLQEWLNDIKGNQLPSLLVGVGPMHSFVQLFQGIRDLFWLPIEQYQKDGRIVRGLQRGANSFTTSTAMAALELTSRLIHLIQVTAETAYDMLSPGPSVRRIKGKRKRYHQPQDIREGMTNAFHVMREGIGQTAENIVQIASLEKEQKGYSGAVGSVLRQIPPNLFKPIILASEAAGNVLTGMQSQLVPDTKIEANQKWRNEQDD